MSNDPEFDVDALLEYLGGDTQFAAEVVDMFFHDTSTSVAGIKKAAASGDYKDLHEHAHALKGNAANIRAVWFRNYAEELCRAALEEDSKCMELVSRLDSEYARVTEVLRGWQQSVRG